jgi:transposase-like protein
MAATKKPRPSRRRYSDEFRANALAALAANGGNTERTAKQLGVPESTLRAWKAGDRHPEAAKECEKKKGPMADTLEAVAWQLLDALPAKIPDASLKETATAMGIAIDKARVLRGLPTDYTAHGLYDLTKLNDQQLADLERILSGARPEGAAERPLAVADLGPGGAVPAVVG